MMILLSDSTTAPPLSAVLLMNVMKEFPENNISVPLKVQIAPAKGSWYLFDAHDTVLLLKATSVLSLKVTLECNEDAKMPQILAKLPLKITFDLSLNMTFELLIENMAAPKLAMLL